MEVVTKGPDKSDRVGCQVVGCGGAGVWYPVLSLYPPLPWKQDNPVELPLHNLPMCGSCARDTRVEHFVGDDTWDDILEAVAVKGKPTPERERTLVIVKRISGCGE